LAGGRMAVFTALLCVWCLASLAPMQYLYCTLHPQVANCKKAYTSRINTRYCPRSGGGFHYDMQAPSRALRPRLIIILRPGDCPIAINWSPLVLLPPRWTNDSFLPYRRIYRRVAPDSVCGNGIVEPKGADGESSTFLLRLI